ncbi:hypothetical protein CLFE_032490 [Clostridium felsineum DSM 794]|nr:hypothetical protein CLFE_032490 [Clostridium felsineum DSM 794]
MFKDGEIKKWYVIIKAGVSEKFYGRYLTKILNIIDKYQYKQNKNMVT